MNAIRRFFDFILDSPTYGRDRGRLISGFTIGTSAIGLNAAILTMLIPILQSPDDPSMQQLTDHVGFSQILALILLGGATVFATVLIPLRLATVFLETRIGRYFDQIVLSGISPLRFLIGKVASQNLFIALFLFLLIPYLVFCVSLGGVNFTFFLAGLFLIWLYCMELALVMLWASLYMNELLAALLVIFVAMVFSVWGCFPMRFQPFILTPIPALIHPVHTSIPHLAGIVDQTFLPKFVACTIGMSLLICVSLIAVYLGPLYGIIRENSTFGEVVRAGDSKRKRWFRLRPHIQRSSEIAFFYVNREGWLSRHEGALRWGTGLCGLLILLLICHVTCTIATQRNFVNWSPAYSRWFASSFHALILSIHGLGLSLAMILFSHAKNSTYLRVPFLFGWKIEVSKLDTTAFLLFWIFSTVASIAVPYQFEQHVAIPADRTIFPLNHTMVDSGPVVDFARTSWEGTFAISLMGLVLYASHRALCLLMWMKSISFAVVGTLYGILVWLLPILFAVMVLQALPELQRIPLLIKLAPVVASVSPMSLMVILFEGRMGQPFPDNLSRFPFYVFHGLLLVATMLRIRSSGRKLRSQYLHQTQREEPHG